MTETIKGLDAYFRRINAVTGPTTRHQLLGLLGLTGVAEAKKLVHRRTGNLGRTIRLGPIGNDSVEILAGGTTTVGYAAWVEFGTRPHDIVPKRAKALAWGGKRTLSGRLASGSKPTMFARRVHHPGTRAYPYLVPGAKAALEKAGLSEVIVQAWNQAA